MINRFLKSNEEQQIFRLYSVKVLGHKSGQLVKNQPYALHCLNSL